MKISSTSYLVNVISRCVWGRIPEKDVALVLKLLADTIPVVLSKGQPVVVRNIGTFHVNQKGYIKFTPSESIKTRVKELGGGKAKPSRRKRECHTSSTS